mgnify:CR=1 FL=1
MAKTGFTEDGNLNEIKQANLAINNILKGGAKPFNPTDLGIFQSNLRYDTAQRLDFIPHNYKFKIRINSPNIAAETNVFNAQRVSDSSPDRVFGTLNLRVETGDAVLNSPASLKDNNYITSLTRSRQEPDTGEITLTRAIKNSEGPFYSPANGIGSVSSVPAGYTSPGQNLIRAFPGNPGENEQVVIVKKNYAAYSPTFGRYTFGKDIEFAFTDGDIISSIRQKGYDTPYDTSPESMYPLKVTNYKLLADGRIQFELIRSVNDIDSPISINYNKFSKRRTPNSPRRNYLDLSFQTPSIIQLTRQLPVSQADFLSNIPSLMREQGGPQYSIVVQNALNPGIGSYSDPYTHFESIPSMYNLDGEFGGGTGLSESSAYASSVETYSNALSEINDKIEFARNVALTRFTTDSPFNNTSGSEITIDGILKVQDPALVNSPGTGTTVGYDSFNNCPFGPAVYIKEGAEYNRAFSTFDGPWTAVTTSGNHAIRTPSTADQSNAEFTKDLTIGKLVFDDRVKISGYSNSLINNPDTSFVRANVNLEIDSPRSIGFRYKMPVIIQETDPTTGEIEDVTYFLLLGPGGSL